MLSLLSRQRWSNATKRERKKPWKKLARPHVPDFQHLNLPLVLELSVPEKGCCWLCLWRACAEGDILNPNSLFTSRSRIRPAWWKSAGSPYGHYSFYIVLVPLVTIPESMRKLQCCVRRRRNNIKNATQLQRANEFDGDAQASAQKMAISQKHLKSETIVMHEISIPDSGFSWYAVNSFIDYINSNQCTLAAPISAGICIKHIEMVPTSLR